jgi:hypothetical protein
MTQPPEHRDNLTDRLRLMRHRKAMATAADEDAGAALGDYLSMDASEALITAAAARLRVIPVPSARWPGDARESLEQCLHVLANALGERRVAWLRRVDGVMLAMEAPAREVLTAPTERYVNRSSDLWLLTAKAADGLSVELNAGPDGEVAFELYCWGEFNELIPT